MRIIAWNIRAGGGRRHIEIFRQLRRWKPEVVTLSEFRATPPSQALAEDLAKIGLDQQIAKVSLEKSATNGLLVATRYPLRPITLPTAPDEPYRWLLVEIQADQPFVMGAMHIPNMVTKRKYPYHDAVLATIKQWQLGPALLIGDTNSGIPDIDEEAPAFGPKEQSWIEALDQLGWVDVFRHLKGNLRAYTWYSPNGKNGFRLDQAFLNQSLLPQAEDVRYVWGKPWGQAKGRRDALSDHAALILDLKEV